MSSSLSRSKPYYLIFRLIPATAPDDAVLRQLPINPKVHLLDDLPAQSVGDPPVVLRAVPPQVRWQHCCSAVGVGGAVAFVAHY